MRWTLIAMALVSAAPAWADSKPTAENEARWQRCAGVAQNIMDRTGATYVRTSPGDHNVFMVHRALHELNLLCRPFGGMAVVGNWDPGGYPSDLFYKTLADATAIVTEDDPSALERAFRSCHDEALRPEADESSEAETGKTAIECRAFMRDGGGVLIDARVKPADSD